MGNHSFADTFPQSEVSRQLEKYVRLLIYSWDKHIDLFPRTFEVEKMAFLRSKKP